MKARWSRRRPRPAASGSIARRDLSPEGRRVCPPWRWGPASMSSVGGMTGAPARAACPARLPAQAALLIKHVVRDPSGNVHRCGAAARPRHSSHLESADEAGLRRNPSGLHFLRRYDDPVKGRSSGCQPVSRGRRTSSAAHRLGSSLAVDAPADRSRAGDWFGWLLRADWWCDASACSSKGGSLWLCGGASCRGVGRR
jgi:hypothetical protein